MTHEGFESLFELIEGASRIILKANEKHAYRVLLADQNDSGVLEKCIEFYRSPNAAMRKEKVPTAGDLIEQPTSKQDATHLAWATARWAIGRFGPYESVQFADGAIAMTVEALGGWIELCGKESKELDMLAWQFVKIYPSFAGTSRAKVLDGILNVTNSANGYTKELRAPRQVPTLGSAPELHELMRHEP